jgi:tetratricopeptide (TPR) repeat protein
VSRLLAHLRRLLPVLAATLALGLGGCGDHDRLSYANELDEPDYREGQSLLKSGRRQEALSAFLKVIDKRDDAAESHLEVGLLYVQHINDPLAAIYHFRKYLALRPNSPQAPLVRQRINAAIREFARTLPAQPLEGQAQRVDLVATLDRLKQENESLKQQLAETKSARGSAAQIATGETPVISTSAPPNNLNFTLESVPTVRTRPAPVAPSRPAPAQTVTPPSTARPAPSAPLAATGPRKHVVRPGDTLSKLAQQYYNNRAKWRDIYAANRSVMKSESDMKVGTELRIP